MDMPKPGDPHKKLAILIGEWLGTETLHPSPWDPAGGTATARVVNRWVADGFAVVQEYEQRRGGKVTFSGHGVFWWDPATQEYVMHWWDSMGGTGGEYRGQFEGNRLVLGAPMPTGGHSRTSWLIDTPGAHSFLMEVSPDGNTWHPAMEGRYKKGPARKAVAKATTTSRKAVKASPKKKAARPVKKAARPVKKAKKR